MIPVSFIPFFSISAGAAATLIGLLFVAVSVAPERTVGKGASMSRRSVAESAFTALLNAILVSLIALIPTAPLSIGALAVTGGTLLGFVRTFAQMIARWRKEPSFSLLGFFRRLFLPVGMPVIYGLEFWWGVGVYRTYHLSEAQRRCLRRAGDDPDRAASSGDRAVVGADWGAAHQPLRLDRRAG